MESHPDVLAGRFGVALLFCPAFAIRYVKVRTTSRTTFQLSLPDSLYLEVTQLKEYTEDEPSKNG